jgi:signal transduction histidine kinase
LTGLAGLRESWPKERNEAMPAATEARPAIRAVAAARYRGAGPRARAVATAGIATAAVVGLALILAAPAAYEAPSLDAMVETTGDLVALFAAYLVAGRFHATGRLDDLVLACGLGALFASGLLLHVLAASEPETEYLAPWTGQLVGALLLAGAAFAPARRLPRARRGAPMLVAASAVLLAACGFALLAGHALRSHAQAPGQAVPVAGALLAAALFAVAAASFTRRADDRSWFAAGCTLASAAALSGLLLRAGYASWLSVDDLAQLLAGLALLVGAASKYREGLAAVAVLEERHRIAREFHDGVAQDLAYIVRRARPERSRADREVAAAAERAVIDTRYVIAALTRGPDVPLDVALMETVGTVADRHRQEVVLDLDANVRVDLRTRDELVRIAGEAVANAARHGRARTVRLELTKARRITLRVADDGVGFEPSSIDRRTHFGIPGMTERARALDADFCLTSGPGRGTEIEVTLP